MLPAQRWQGLKQSFFDSLTMPPQCIRGSLQIDRAPEHDSRHHQQVGGPVSLLLEITVRIPLSLLKSKARASPLRASQLFSKGLAYFAIRILMRPHLAHLVIHIFFHV